MIHFIIPNTETPTALCDMKPLEDRRGTTKIDEYLVAAKKMPHAICNTCNAKLTRIMHFCK